MTGFQRPPAIKVCKTLRGRSQDLQARIKKAHKRIEEINEDKSKKTWQNSISLSRNIIPVTVERLRILFGVISAGSPLRYAMMGSMAFSRGAEGLKEVRLENEELIDKTRIQDADKAAEEAWRIYEEVSKTRGVN